MKFTKWIVAGALVVPTLSVPAFADPKTSQDQPHQTVTLKQLPAKVRATVQRESKGKTVEWMAKEQQNGKTVYEIEVVSGGKGREIEIAMDGKVITRRAEHDEATEGQGSGMNGTGAGSDVNGTPDTGATGAGSNGTGTPGGATGSGSGSGSNSQPDRNGTEPNTEPQPHPLPSPDRTP